jgi:hypothetical protein
MILPCALKIPNSDRYEDFLEHIRKFPDMDTPAMFGLP